MRRKNSVCFCETGDKEEVSDHLLVLFLKLPEEKENERAGDVLSYALEGVPHEILSGAEDLLRLHREQGGLWGRKILFAVPVGKYGINPEYYALLAVLRENPGLLNGCVGGILVDGEGELYTKHLARELAFSANLAGCAFVGRPLAEGTGSLSNYEIIAANLKTDLMGAYRESGAILVRDLLGFDASIFKKEKPNLLVIHASSHETSNTFALWKETKKYLEEFTVTEIGLRNGTLSDCSGCPYKMCLHFGERGSCFYGGVMAEDVYPAVRACSALMVIAPNYNDAVSANITAFINRLTALFRQVRFYDKALFAIIVSGYSGSDILAEQLLGGLGMNKSFFLPPRFALMETANNAGAAMRLPGIEERIADFAGRIREVCLQETDSRPKRPE